MEIIRASEFGIHDVSRVELDVVNGLPRFNMPLELGLFLGAKAYGDQKQKDKRCLILDTEPGHRIGRGVGLKGVASLSENITLR